nr:RNA-directed DNA polymerase, eukaryota, reverse transcriptase zinc-binding domain protein [Tanacetum cinerariifolium]
MAFRRSKEDDVNRISTSIFITNFLDSFKAKDLFQACKQYGHVVDSFIPVKGTREDDECVCSKDLSNSLMGMVKESASITNLKTALLNEGFGDLTVKYLGELWVLFEFSSTKLKEAFRDNVGVNSWFSEIRQASLDINPDGRIVWVEVEGVPFKLWSMNSFRRIASKWGGLIDVDDIEEYCFHLRCLCMFTKCHTNIFETFKIIFHGKVYWIRAKKVPGWVPEMLEKSDEEEQSIDGSMEGDNNNNDENNVGDKSDTTEIPETVFDESCGQKENKSDDPFDLYPLLNKNKKGMMDKVKEVNSSPLYPPGFTPNNETNDNYGMGENSVNCNAKEEINVGGGGSDNAKSKEYGVWIKNGIDILIIVVYAPHDSRDKRMLWDYLVHVVNQWHGEVVIMGDFNEVRYKSDRRILLREKAFDFGPIPFRFFHHWFEIDSFRFEKPVERRATIEMCYPRTLLSEQCNDIERMVSKEEIKAAVWDCGTDKSPGPDGFTFGFYRQFWPIIEEDVYTAVSHFFNYCDIPNGYVKGRLVLSEKLKEDLRLVDKIIDQGAGTEAIAQKRGEVLNNLHNIDQMHAMDLAQKAKIKWSIEGDENSSFFHGMLNKKRNQISIQGIMVDGVWKEQPMDVKRECLLHFQTRFGKPVERRATIEMCYPRTLLSEQCNDIKRMVSKEEIKAAVWDCGTDKSLGPDGFTFGFYRQFWPIIEEDVYTVVSYFFNYCDIPNGCNSSFITLIPKLPDAKLVKDFRPISLIGSTYKIIANNLANRLVAVLGDIADEVQSAFIAGRQILDGPFILNEVLQWCTKKMKKSLNFKVDFEKAYDSVRWDFLDDVLKKFGFCNKWCNWIQCCLKSSRGSILVNESPTEEFQFLKRVIDAGLFKGVQLNKEICLSHLFYVDDTVFVGQLSDGNINTLMHVLDCFHYVSGLKINMSKSKIMWLYVDDTIVHQAASKLGCLVLNSHFLYLGTKVGGAMSRVQAWKEILDKVKSRLSKWKLKTLSIGGHLTLLKSVLGSIPIFHMSIFRVPSKVLQVLESIRGQFFNGHDMGSNKATWVKWNSVLTDKNHEGLRVSSLYALNRGLMLKWVWKFLWTKVITAIHGVNGNLYSECKMGGRSCWLSVVNEIRVLQIKRVDIFKFLKLRLGNGDMIKFWLDNWYEGGILKHILPRLYALENEKEVTVSSKLNALNLEWVWSLENSGEFTVAFTRKLIDEVRLLKISDMTRWVKCVPIKVNILAWKIRSDALPTRINISKRQKDCRWWNINFEEVNSFEEWKRWIVSCRMDTKLKHMFEGI